MVYMKTWTEVFDLQNEVLQVIPNWIDLPSEHKSCQVQWSKGYCFLPEIYRLCLKVEAHPSSFLLSMQSLNSNPHCTQNIKSQLTFYDMHWILLHSYYTKSRNLICVFALITVNWMWRWSMGSLACEHTMGWIWIWIWIMLNVWTYCHILNCGSLY